MRNLSIFFLIVIFILLTTLTLALGSDPLQTMALWVIFLVAFRFEKKLGVISYILASTSVILLSLLKFNRVFKPSFDWANDSGNFLLLYFELGNEVYTTYLGILASISFFALILFLTKVIRNPTVFWSIQILAIFLILALNTGWLHVDYTWSIR